MAVSASTTKGTFWCEEEIKALIKIWGEENIQSQLDGAVRNKNVYMEIAKQLSTQGYDRDWEQCKNKVKNLKKIYREVKDNNGETGRGRKTCKFYDELDSILGHRPASVPTVLLDTGEESAHELETNGKTVYDYFILILGGGRD